MAMVDDMKGSHGASSVIRFPRFASALAGRLRRARAYRSVVAELSALSDQELHDLGLSKAMIGGIARETARAA